MADSSRAGERKSLAVGGLSIGQSGTWPIDPDIWPLERPAPDAGIRR